MFRLGRRPVLVGAAITLVAGAVSALPMSSASSDTPVSTTAGIIRFHVGTDGRWVRYEPATGAATQQALTVSGTCAATLASGPIAITPAGGTLGFASNGLGVRGTTKDEGSGQKCGQVNAPSQALTIALAGALAGQVVDYADLDVEGKFGGAVKAELFKGTQLVGTQTLAAGPSSDNGPDSGPNDNVRFVIQATTPFDRLRLSVDPSTPRGAFSLEGGGDGGALAGGPFASLNTRDSVLRVVRQYEDGIGCGEQATDGQAVLERQANTDGSTCQEIPYTLTSSPGKVLLEKDIAGQTASRFKLVITWDPEPATNPLKVTTIDFLNGTPPAPAKWCDLDANGVPQPPAGVSWCLGEQHGKSAGSGTVQVTETFYGTGDPGFTRG